MSPHPLTQNKAALDEANRRTALDPRKSFIIDAPAGAGKTELLTQRYLALLGQVDDPEEVVALSFTQKAAAEMRHRVLGSLQAALGPLPDEAHKQITYHLAQKVLKRSDERQWHLLSQASRMQITTFDALCARLARHMPLLSRLGHQPAIADDPEPLYVQAVQAGLRMLDDETEASDVLMRVLDAFDHDSRALQELLVAMLGRRDQWLHHGQDALDFSAAESALTQILVDAMAPLCQHWTAERQTQLMPVARHVAAVLAGERAAAGRSDTPPDLLQLQDWQVHLDASAESLPQWRGLAQLLLTQKGEPRSATTLRQPGLKKDRGEEEDRRAVLRGLLSSHLSWLASTPSAVEALKRVHRLPLPVYTEAEKAALQDLLKLLKWCLAQLWLVMRRAGQIDFIQMAQNALQALGEDDAPSELLLQLDYRIQHLLIDEFQDTSPTQVRMIERLTQGWQTHGERTLFLVGDPMQSIYRFRKADVGLFLHVRARGLGPVDLHPLTLFRNNRSHPAVVDWVNQSFMQVFPGQSNSQLGAVSFSESFATRSETPHSGVFCHALPLAHAEASEEPDSDESPDDREAQCVIDLIREVQARDPEGRIAVLVRARSHLKALVPALRQAGLGFQAVDIEPLSERQVIEDLDSLTRALLHEADRVHWLAVLRAPWCGLTLADLLTLAGDAPDRTLWECIQDPGRWARLSADGQTRLGHVRSVLQRSLPGRGRQRTRLWVEGIWQALGGPMCLQHAGEWRDAQAYLDLLDRVDHAGQIDLAELEERLSKLYAEPDPQAPRGLQIMTIHKSKGLEFETVILPGLDRRPRSVDVPLMLWDECLDAEGRAQLVPAILPRALAREHRLDPGQASKHQLLQDFEKEREAQEARRLMYVAATRAKRELHLVGRLKAVSETECKPPSASSLLGLWWPSVQAAFTQSLAQVASTARSGYAPAVDRPDASTPAVSLAGFVARLMRVKEPATPDPWRCDAPASPSSDPNAGLTTPPPDPRLADDLATEGLALASDVGTLVHRHLEWMALEGLDQWTEDILQAALPTMAQWLRRQGHPPAAAEQGAEQALAHLLNTRRSEAGRWILQSRPEAASEMAWTRVEAAGLSNHVIDRTFVEAGVRWIIDYKTTRFAHPDPQSAIGQAHAAQLRRYAQLFEQDDRPLRLAIFYTHSGQLSEVPFQPSPP